VDKFGFESDTYLGLLKIDNKWSEDGHEFFARTRILRFLEEARASETLEKSDRVRVERLAARLKDLIPQQGPSLCHGDLGNLELLLRKEGM
jgi:fructosamine-3-kinase